MFGRARRLLGVVAALALACSSVSGETLEEILKIVEKRGAEIKDMSCTMTMEMDIMRQKVSMSGGLQMKPPGRMAMAGDMRMQVQNQKMDMKMTMISDGETLYQEVAFGGQRMVNRIDLAAAGMRAEDMPVAPGMGGIGGPESAAESLKQMMDVEVLADETLNDGQKAWVIKGKLKPEMLRLGGAGDDAEKMKSLMSGMKVYVGKKDRVVNRMDFLSDQNEKTGSIVFDNVRVNEGIDDKVFTYTVPEGAMVNDMTETVKRQREAVAGMKNPAERGGDENVPEDAAPSKVLKAGVEAPAFSLKAIDGTAVELAGLRGKHVVVLFWASWHKGSVSVLKEADELSRDFKARGLEVVALSLDDAAELDAVKKAVADGKIGVKVALCGDETYGAYWVSRVPTYVLVDPRGKALSSEADPKDLRTLRGTLEKALPK